MNSLLITLLGYFATCGLSIGVVPEASSGTTSTYSTVAPPGDVVGAAAPSDSDFELNWTPPTDWDLENDRDDALSGLQGYRIPNPTPTTDYHDDEYHVTDSNGTALVFKHPTLTRRGDPRWNNYKLTPTPGLYMCTGPNFSGSCEWHPVVQDPAVCGQVPEKFHQRMSLGIDKDIMCSIHGSAKCDGGHTSKSGNLMWSGDPDIKANTRGMGGPIMAYRCIPCPGCRADKFRVWDGTAATQKPKANDADV